MRREERRQQTNSELQDARKRAGRPADREMLPETRKPRTAQQDRNQRAASVRKPSTWSTSKTEYQERFCPNFTQKTIYTTVQKHPYHQLKGTCNDTTAFKSLNVFNPLRHAPLKVPQPPVPVQCHRIIDRSPRHHPAPDEMTTAPLPCTSVYRHDFPAWNASRRLPCKFNDNLQAKYGLVVRGPSLGVAALPQVYNPFEGTTSYRSDYVVHPLTPWTRRGKPDYQSSRGFLPPIRADHMMQGYQRTNLVLPSIQAVGKSAGLSRWHPPTTAREDHRAWKPPQRFPSVCKQAPDCAHRPAFNAECSKVYPRSFKYHPVCNTSCSTTKKHLHGE